MSINREALTLPSDIEMFEAKLHKARNDIASFSQLSDGLVLGKIGLDAFLGIIPVVDGLYTGFAGIWLLVQAGRVRASLGDKFFLLFLTIVDVVIGVFVGMGDIFDAFFRVHAWIGDRLVTHVDTQLSLIDRARSQISQNANFDLTPLRDALFRGGKTEKQQNTIYMTIAGIVVILITIGAVTEYSRQQKISACEARGDWFCSWRY